MEWKEPYAKTESVTIADVSTRIVTAPRRYHPGQGDLMVYLNGMFCRLGTDYNEITPYSIEFLDDLEMDDVVVFHYQKLW